MYNCNKILIVDDDQDDRALLSEVIQELYPNLKWTTAGNGEEALQYIQADPQPPTVIFLDLNMPILNGYEFLRDYIKTDKAKESNIIIYSTSSHPRDREITKGLGASDYLVKQSSFTELKFKVKELLSKYC